MQLFLFLSNYPPFPPTTTEENPPNPTQQKVSQKNCKTANKRLHASLPLGGSSRLRPHNKNVKPPSVPGTRELCLLPNTLALPLDLMNSLDRRRVRHQTAKGLLTPSLNLSFDLLLFLSLHTRHAPHTASGQLATRLGPPVRLSLARDP